MEEREARGGVGGGTRRGRALDLHRGGSWLFLSTIPLSSFFDFRLQVILSRPNVSPKETVDFQLRSAPRARNDKTVAPPLSKRLSRPLTATPSQSLLFAIAMAQPHPPTAEYPPFPAPQPVARGGFGPVSSFSHVACRVFLGPCAATFRDFQFSGPIFFHRPSQASPRGAFFRSKLSNRFLPLQQVFEPPLPK